MSKPILIALLVVLLAGGGIAFAQTEAVNGLLGLEVPPEVEDKDDGFDLDQEVSQEARDIDLDNELEENIPEIAEKARDEKDEPGKSEEEERSPVADAVLEVLGDGSLPGDEGFGDNVSRQAQEDGKQLGKDVSDAARKANNSAGKGGR